MAAEQHGYTSSRMTKAAPMCQSCRLVPATRTIRKGKQVMHRCERCYQKRTESLRFA